MLPHLVNQKIYEHLDLDDKLRFQEALGQIFHSEKPTHEKLTHFICPVCVLSKMESLSDFVKKVGDKNFFVSKSVSLKIKRFSRDLEAQSKFAWRKSDSHGIGSLTCLIDHINLCHLNEETRKVFQVILLILYNIFS